MERVADGKLSVCKITFGPEPRDYEVWAFLLQNIYRLSFSPAVDATVTKEVRNPKRIQREVHRQVQSQSVGTKSQQALKLQHEEKKTERKLLSKQQKEEQQQLLYERKMMQKKEKHKGR